MVNRKLVGIFLDAGKTLQDIFRFYCCGPPQPDRAVRPLGGSMPKNVVISCDGTGNEFGGDCNSNVLKLYSTLMSDDNQCGYC